MAEEVGSAWLSIVPSARGFSAKLKAELKKAVAAVKGEGVEVPVTPVFDQKLLNESLKTQRTPLRVPVVLEPIRGGVDGRLDPVKVPVEIDRDAYRRQLLGLSNDSSSTIHQKVRVDLDKDFARTQLADAAKQSGSTASSLFSSGFSSSLPVFLAGAVAAALGAPFIALATGSLLLAGAALGSVFFGAFLLRGDADLQKGVQTLFDDVGKTLTDAAKPLKGPFLEALGIIGQAFKDIAPDVQTFFKDIADSGGIQELARGFGGAIKSLSETGALKKLGEAIGPVLKQIGMAMPDIANAFSQLLITITKPKFIEFIGTLLRGLADVIRFVGDAIDWLSSFVGRILDIIGLIGAVASVVIAAVTGGPRKLLAAISEAVSYAVKVIRERWTTLWNGVVTAVKTTVNTVVTTVKGLPGKITGALGDAKTFLFTAGKNVIQGLINGIKDKLGALGNIMSTVGGTIWNYLQHSPAKLGPLAGHGNTFYSGQAIATGLAAGVESKLPTVAGAASQLAGSFGFGGASASAAAPSAPTILLDAGGSRAGQVLVDLLAEIVDTRYGGDVQKAFKRR